MSKNLKTIQVTLDEELIIALCGRVYRILLSGFSLVHTLGAGVSLRARPLAICLSIATSVPEVHLRLVYSR